MIDMMARPIVELLGAFGTGRLPTGSPADALMAASDTLDAVHALGRVAIGELDAAWTGAAADAAIGKAHAMQSASVELSDRGREIAVVVEAASETVRVGTAELQSILESFLSLAASALPLLATPAGQTMLIAAAVDHLGRALSVVERVRGELAADTTRMVELTAPDPVPDAPRPLDTGRVLSAVAASYSDPPAQTHAGPAVGTVGLDSGSVGSSSAEPGSAAASSSYDPGFGGSGVEILLPDGSTAVAPNQEAANAVRAALTQQGVPYQWGGTTPDQGLDCSGLTQWAYGEAGVDLPRLAQEQSIGVPVGQDALMPGDLAVWDGHVAMVIGNGQMIEAGDPVSVSSIRTSNSGMGFHGFYRPTE